MNPPKISSAPCSFEVLPQASKTLLLMELYAPLLRSVRSYCWAGLGVLGGMADAGVVCRGPGSILHLGKGLQWAREHLSA